MKKQIVLASAALGLLFASASMAAPPTSSEILRDANSPVLTSRQDNNTADSRSIMTSAGGTSAAAAVVPEPGSLLLIGIGLAGIGLARRRRS